jgi:5-formyltetrahydrofolate cyclo-ligase
MSSIRSFKSATRKDIAFKLSALDRSTIKHFSKLTTNSVISLPVFQNANSVALYMHLPDNELQTDLLINECFKLNKNVYLPRIESLSKFNDTKNFNQQKSCIHFLSVDSINTVNSLKPRGKYQIREPDYTENHSNDLLLNNKKLDLILLPGVAFTPNGKRLGHGAGYYDDFIKRYRAIHNSQPTLVGIALPQQIIQDHIHFQIEAHDEMLDYVVAGNDIYSCCK